MKLVKIAFAVLLLTVFAVAQTTHFKSTELGFEITFPTEVKALEPTQEKTDKGHPFVMSDFMAINSNGQYLVTVAVYSDITPTAESLESVIKGAVAGVPGATLAQETACLPGAPQPCRLALIAVPPESDHSAMKLFNMVTCKDNRIYEVMFGAATKPTPDMKEVADFLMSFKLLKE